MIQLVTNRNDEIGKILRGKILKRTIIPDNETDIMVNSSFYNTHNCIYYDFIKNLFL